MSSALAAASPAGGVTEPGVRGGVMLPELPGLPDAEEDVFTIWAMGAIGALVFMAGECGVPGGVMLPGVAGAFGMGAELLSE